MHLSKKNTSFSVSFMLHRVQIRLLTLRPTYRPVSSRSGRIPHPSCAKCDFSVFDNLANRYFSVPKSVLNCLHVRSLDTYCILFDQFDLCKFNNRSSTVFKFTESLFWKLDVSLICSKIVFISEHQVLPV